MQFRNAADCSLRWTYFLSPVGEYDFCQGFCRVLVSKRPQVISTHKYLCDDRIACL